MANDKNITEKNLVMLFDIYFWIYPYKHSIYKLLSYDKCPKGTIINVDKKSHFDEYLRMKYMNINEILITRYGSEEILLNLLLICHPGAR